MARPPAKTPRQRKRIKWLASCTSWTRIGEERMYNEILVTRVNRKPPAYKCETTDDKGNQVVVALEKAQKGVKGWVVYLEQGAAQIFRYKRQAMAWIADLQVTQVTEVEAASIKDQIEAGAKRMLAQGEEE